MNNAQLQRIFELETQIKTYQTNFAQTQQQKVTNWNGMSDEEKEQYTKQYQQHYAQYYQQQQQQQQQNHLLPIGNTHLAPAGSSEYESMTASALTDDASHNTEHSHSLEDKDTLRCAKTLHGNNTMMNIHEYISDELKQEMGQNTDVVILEEEEEDEDSN